MNCSHNNIVGDNYGESCLDCGEQLRGFGYGGWFGANLTGPRECIHQWLPIGTPPYEEDVCPYCEAWRQHEETPA